jgi:tetratricopeptide (TPR) repeat protein
MRRSFGSHSAAALAVLVAATVSLPNAAAGAQDRAELTMPPNGDNQKAEVSQWIGLVKVTISYHSPRVHFQGRERTGHIWGELIPYGLYDEGFGPSRAAPWRAGANETTTLTVSHDVQIDGKTLRAGTYALFLELASSGPWTWIVSTNPGWGAFQFDSSEVALRVSVTPADAPFTEFLTYAFDNRLPNSATAYLQWENKRIPLRIDVPNVNELYAIQMGKELRSWPGFNYQNWQAAAQFAAATKVHLEEALVWADKAIYEPFRNAAQGREDFSTLQTKASVLSAMGRETDADTVMDHAIRLPDTDARSVHQYGMRTLATGRKERAMQVFQANRRLHPTDRFWPYVGLARGYTALGDKQSAIASWKVALENVPPGQKPNVAVFQRALEALRSSR